MSVSGPSVSQGVPKEEARRASAGGPAPASCAAPAFWERIISDYVPFVLAAAPAAVFAVFVWRFGVNVLHWDEWANVDLYERFMARDVDWWTLFKSHNNEHHEFFKHIVELLIERLTGFNMKAVMYAGVALQLGAFLLLLKSAVPVLPRGRWSKWLAVPLAWLMFSLCMHVDALWALGIAWFMLTFCLAAELYFLGAACAQGRGGSAAWAAFAAAAAAGFVGSFCSADGPLLWPAGAAYLWLRGEGGPRAPWRNAKLAAWLLLGAAVWGLYFGTLGVGNIGQGGGLGPKGALMLVAARPAYALRFFAAAIGSIVIEMPAGAAAGIGAALLAALFVSAARALRSPRPGSYALAAGLVVFGLCHALILTLGRLHTGIDGMLSPAYAYYRTCIIPLVAGVFIGTMEGEWFREGAGLSRAFRVLAWSFFFAVLAFNNTYKGWLHGRGSRLQRWMSAAVLLDYRNQPAMRVERLVSNEPDAQHFYRQAGYLERNGLHVFRAGQGRIPEDVRKWMVPPPDFQALGRDNPEYKPALERLWDVYLVSQDMKTAFNPASRDFTPRLIGWAHDEALEKGYYLHPYLEPYSAEYVALAEDVVGKPSRPASWGAFQAAHPESKAALARLWHAYLAAPDLQKAYPMGSPTFVKDLLAWTAAEVKAKGHYLHPQLEPYAKEYLRLSGDAGLPAQPKAYAEFSRRHAERKAALDRLWRVYLMGPDLQKAFPSDKPVFIRDLLAWASAEVRSKGHYLHAKLAEFGDDYAALAPAAAAEFETH